MSNFKWGSISGSCALAISILLGMVFGVGVIHIVIRAFVFFAVFFGLGFGLRFILDSFFPELLYTNEETVSSEVNEPGEHISIAMDSAGEYAVPELFNKKGSSEELGNIEDLISGVFRSHAEGDDFAADKSQSTYPHFDFSMSSDEGIDLKKEAGYNDSGVIEDIPFSGDTDAKPVNFNETSADEKQAASHTQFTPSFGDDSGLGGLPDLDMMAMAFSSTYATPSSTVAPSASLGPSAHPAEEFEPDRSQYKGNKPQPLKGDYNPKSLAEGIRTVLSKE